MAFYPFRVPAMPRLHTLLALALCCAASGCGNDINHTDASSDGGSGGDTTSTTTTSAADPCADSVCNAQASCVTDEESELGYDCVCNDGWDGDGQICKDIDECGLDLDDCNDTEVCENTQGSYECVCPAGQIYEDDDQCVARYVTVAAAEDTTCVASVDQSAWCFGRGTNGQLGNDDNDHLPSPVQVGKSFQWVQLTMGGRFGCGIKDYGAIWCWGRNNKGQLGNGRN